MTILLLSFLEFPLYLLLLLELSLLYLWASFYLSISLTSFWVLSVFFFFSSSLHLVYSTQQEAEAKGLLSYFCIFKAFKVSLSFFSIFFYTYDFVILAPWKRVSSLLVLLFEPTTESVQDDYRLILLCFKYSWLIIYMQGLYYFCPSLLKSSHC